MPPSRSISIRAIFRKSTVFSSENRSSSSCFLFCAFLSLRSDSYPCAWIDRLYSTMYSFRCFLKRR